MMQRLWQSQKSGFRGKGGKRAFWGAVGILTAQGQIEGDVGRSPMQGDWIALATKVTGVRQHVEQKLEEGRVGSLGAGMGMGLYIDLGSATRSSRRPAEDVGLLYVGIDKREWVYSAEEKTWVQNWVVDYAALTPSQLWQEIRDAVQAEMAAVMGCVWEVYPKVIWVSPPCHTYSLMDATNQTRGCNYRDHSFVDPQTWLRTMPPRTGRSRYRTEAQRSDALVIHVLQILQYFWDSWEAVVWFIENPVGLLRRRPFMTQMTLPHRLLTVDYCAYEGDYKKPTNLWTNLADWQPRGTTNTGRCGGKCKMGFKGKGGRWNHFFTLAQGSKEARGGMGRRARKEQVPRMLHQELLYHWGQIEDFLGGRRRQGMWGA